ncbi:MAG TPA: helix-turn-helix domain-containing protein [Anaerolineae bacterium]|nr:helix-turn-helix domain-containing protein [Anaerolineae bacterium]
MAEKKSELSDKQEMALELVITGMTDREIAKRVGVSRQWVNTWRNQDAEFMYALQLRRQILREKHMDSVSQLIKISIDVMRAALKEGDPQTKLKTAMYVLKISGLKGFMKPGKPLSRQEMEKDQFKNAFDQAVREVTEELGIEKY